jgi:hypothetical protein
MNAQPNSYAVYISWLIGSSGFFMAFDAILRRRGRYGLHGEMASWLLLPIARL